MTNSAEVVDTDDRPAPDVCPACPHVLSAHDRISSRWCVATAAGAARDCVCGAVVPVARDLSYYGGHRPKRT